MVAAEPHVEQHWSEHGLRPVLKTAGIYDPDAIVLREATIPRPDGQPAGALGRRDRQAEG